MCKAREKSKTLGEKTTSNEQGKLKASEAESMGKPQGSDLPLIPGPRSEEV